jgi:hypothetical protein
LGLSATLPILEQSVVCTPSGSLCMPWILLLVGHHVGARHPKDSPERLALERTHPWTAVHSRSTAHQLEAERAIVPQGKGAPCMCVALVRGARMTATAAFRGLPASAKAAYGETSNEVSESGWLEACFALNDYDTAI